MTKSKLWKETDPSKLFSEKIMNQNMKKKEKLKVLNLSKVKQSKNNPAFLLVPSFFVSLCSHVNQ